MEEIRVKGVESLCGRDCENCAYFKENACSGCVSSKSNLTYYCAVYRCITYDIHDENINPECEYCYFKGECPKSRLHGIFKPFIITKAEGFKVDEKVSPQIAQGEFMPAIVFGDARSYFWNKGVDLPIKRLVLKYHELLKIENHKVFWHSKREGLRKTLNIPEDIEIYISTVMPDFILEDLSPEKFARDVLKVRADGIIVYDGYDYISMPKEMTYQSLYRAYDRLMRVLKCTRGSDLNIIAILLGSHQDQYEYYLKQIEELGFKTVAITSRGFIELKLIEHLKSFVKLAKEHFNYVIAYGCDSPKIFRYIQANGFSGSGWFEHALEGKAYYKGDLIDARRHYVLCNCPICKGRPLDEVAKNVEELALHNLLFIINHARKESL